jgi:PLD-like domain
MINHRARCNRIVGIFLAFKFVFIFLYSQPSHANYPQYEWGQAHEHVGEKVIIVGKILHTKNTNKACFLEFGKHPNNNLYLVIFSENIHKFKDAPEQYFKGKHIKALGKISEYRGRPQIIISDPKQIELFPAKYKWHEAANHLGEYIKIEGNISSTKKTSKFCYLNFHENYKEYPSIKIATNNLKNFPGAPEDFYLNKDVIVTGILTGTDKGPKISATHPSDIEIMNSTTHKVEQPGLRQSSISGGSGEIKSVPNDAKSSVVSEPNYWLYIVIGSSVFMILSLLIIKVKNRNPAIDEKLAEVQDSIKNDLRKELKVELLDELDQHFVQIQKGTLGAQEIEELREKINGKVLYNEEIRPYLENTFKIAKREIDIISPWLSHNAVDNKLINLMRAALNRDVKIRIIYGYEGGEVEQNSRQFAAKISEIFQPQGNLFKITRVNTHEKLLLCDDRYIMVGSYNLLSFGGKYNKGTRNEMMLYSQDYNLLKVLRKKHFQF